MSSSSRKRSAPDTAPGAPTQPPNLRTSGMAASLLPGDLATDSPMTMLATYLESLSKEELLKMIISMATTIPSVRTVVEDAQRVKATKEQQALIQKAKNEKKKLSTIPSFENFMTRVENYMYKDIPFSWGRSREISEAVRVCTGIEKMHDQILDRCPLDSNYAVRATGMEAMVHIWHIVIFAGCSYTHRYCVSSFIFCERKFLAMWARFTAGEKFKLGQTGNFLKTLIEVGKEWAAHGAHEAMFVKVVTETRANSQCASSSPTQGLQSPPASDPPSEMIDLTGE